MHNQHYSSFDFERSRRRYLATLRYIELIRQSGKIQLLTRSQVNAIRARLNRCLKVIRKYIRLTTMTSGLCALSQAGIDAQCRMNRLPITTQTSFNTTSSRVSPTFADIDGDGDPELIIGNFQGEIFVYAKEGNLFKRSYGLLNPFDGVDVGKYASPTFADIDEDGDQDAFVGSLQGTIYFFENTNGSFTKVNGPANPFYGVTTSMATSPSFVDIDEDGDQDAVLGSGDGLIRFFQNKAGSLEEVYGNKNPFYLIDVGDASAPTFVDIDGDGDQDVIVGEEDGTINFIENMDGSFDVVTGSGNPFNGVDLGQRTKPAFVDIDGDGDPDAFIGGRFGGLHHFRNNNGSFVQIANTDHPFDELGILRNYASPTFADLDSNGDYDAFVGLSNGTIRSFSNSNGTFSELLNAGNPFIDVDVGYYARPVILAGIDEDVDQDLIVGAQDGKIHFFENINGIFTEATGLDNPLNMVNVGNFSAPAFVDFDDDMDKDAFVGAEDGTIHYYENINGTFVERTGVGNPFNGITVGARAVPTFDLITGGAPVAYIGSADGTIKMYRKNSVLNKYELVVDAPFVGVDVGSSAAPSVVDILSEYPGPEVVIGNAVGHLFVFSDQGGRSNLWLGPFTSNWHSSPSNWELLSIPELQCDDVHVNPGSILRVSPSQIAASRTLTVRRSGQFEVNPNAQLVIKPD